MNLWTYYVYRCGLLDPDLVVLHAGRVNSEICNGDLNWFDVNCVTMIHATVRT